VIRFQPKAFGKEQSPAGMEQIFRQHHSRLEIIDIYFTHLVGFFERNVIKL
jgi:hypothetical protein